VANFFFDKARNSVGDVGMQVFCIDNGLKFLTDKNSLETTANWIYSGFVSIQGTKLECEFTDSHRHAIVKEYNASTHFTPE
jgi:hypothetical protein